MYTLLKCMNVTKKQNLNHNVVFILYIMYNIHEVFLYGKKEKQKGTKYSFNNNWNNIVDINVSV